MSSPSAKDKTYFYFQDENAESGTMVSSVVPVMKAPPTYPSEWFVKNPKKKPSLVSDYKNSSLSSLTKLIKTKINKTSLTSQEATAFLLAFAKEKLSVKVQKNWESFGLELAKSGDEISPLILAEISYKDKEVMGQAETYPEPDEPEWMALYIVMMYKLGTTDRSDYKDTMVKKSLNLFQSLGVRNPPAINAAVTAYTGWMLDTNFCRVIAMIDMFLDFVPDLTKPYQFLRFGTKMSRYRDCAALSAYVGITPIFGFKSLSDLADWIFTKPIAKSYMAIMKEGQELDKPESYMPYSRDFGLFERSPYSNTANPEFHLFLHVAGCLLGSEWSLKALCVELRDAFNCCYNGLILAYGHRENVSMYKAFRGSKDHKKKGLPLASGIKKAEVDAFRQCKTANEFLEWIRSTKDRMHPDLISFYEGRKSNFENRRENAISTYILKNFP